MEKLAVVESAPTSDQVKVELQTYNLLIYQAIRSSEV